MQCPDCRGSGDCQNCGGTGRERFQIFPTDCVHCASKGNGKCANCRGRGTVPG